MSMLLNLFIAQSVRDACRLVATDGKACAASAELITSEGQIAVCSINNVFSQNASSSISDGIILPRILDLQSLTSTAPFDDVVVAQIHDAIWEQPDTGNDEEIGLSTNIGDSVGGCSEEDSEREDELWLDPSLRSSPTIAVGTTLPGQLMRDLNPCNEDSTAQNPCEEESSPLAFPEWPPQTWEMYSAVVLHANNNGSTSTGFVQSDTNMAPHQSPQARRPPAPKVPVMLGDKHLEWLENSHKCLSDDNSGTIWSETIEAWLRFERDLPLANVSSVSGNISFKLSHLSNSM